MRWVYFDVVVMCGIGVVLGPVTVLGFDAYIGCLEQ